MTYPIFLALLFAFGVGAMVGQFAERDFVRKALSEPPRATATRRQRMAWRRERLVLPRIPNGWRS